MVNSDVLNVLVDAGSGGTASVVSLALVYPLEKVRLRLQDTRASSGSRRRSVLATMKSILDEEGLDGLYGGVQSICFSVGVSQALYFFWYSLLQRSSSKWLSRKSSTSALSQLGMTSLAGSLNVICTTPLWVASTRLVLQKKQRKPARTLQDRESGAAAAASGALSGSDDDDDESPAAAATASASKRAPQRNYNGLLDALRVIFRDEGVAGLYKGLVASLTLVSNPAIQYTTVHQMRKLLAKYMGLRTLTRLQTFVLGALAKLLSTLITYPLQTVKTRSQARTATGAQRYSSLVDAVRTIYEEEGSGALYQGLSAKLFQTVLNAAILLVIYEDLRVFFQRLMIPAAAAHGL